MLNYILFAQLILAVLVTPAFATQPMFIVTGTVTKVNNGDTIQVWDSGHAMELRVRLYGIDAPDTGKKDKSTDIAPKPKQPYGNEAFQALKSKIEWKTVKLEIYDKDKNKRMVSVVWLGDRNINREMVKEGQALVFRPNLIQSHVLEYIKDEEEAKTHKRGLWK